ncbi:MAG: efflux RND transporter periplasmic adaptor subunit [Bacteroidales bacterium]|nr:efflux RND transporter periplasmic adaptor subunit [Bacteroidales bacterium]MCF8336439.1 efflux RND transporter periplasmic adaptor subunit [Bacteroidales bacterium]
MKKKTTLIISLAALAVAAVVVLVIFSTEPTAKRAGATKQTAMLVNVIEVEKGTYRPEIEAMGTVEPSQDIVLSPRVSGEIMERSDAFTPGGYVQKGEVLLQIDPSDYKNTLEQRKSELLQAQADLNVEMGRQTVAEKDYQLIDETLSEKNKDLVLRKPQLNAARSRVQSAKAAVEQAKLELNRTTIKAPFDAHILSRNVNVGSQVSPGQNLGRLVGRETYWVEATVPVSKLRWISFPEGDTATGSDVLVRNRSAWPEGEYRKGYLYRLVGSLEDETRMARVLVNVPDPLAYNAKNEEKPALMIGSYVQSKIKGKRVTNVIRLNRDYVRKNETVWVMEDEKLRIQDVDIMTRDAENAYIREGLSDGDKVVTTNLSTVADGAKLRVKSDTTVNNNSSTGDE